LQAKGAGGKFIYENPRSVVLQLQTTDRKGLQLSLALEGMEIEIVQ